MGMGVGNSGGVRSDINVTPLVDVVLVLLIIFMVVTPLLEKELAVKVPQIETQEMPQPDNLPQDQVLIQMRDDKVFLNNEEIPHQALQEKLTALNQNRKEKVVFFDAADSVNYGFAVKVLDIIKSSGTSAIGMMMPDPQAPPIPGGAPTQELPPQ